MRKLLLLAVSLLLTVTTIFAERVSQADAALVAKNFMSAPAVQTGVKKAVPTEMVLKKAASAEENQYYVYENANGEGWVMVAANDAAYPILAYSPAGKFNTENQPKNVKRWLRSYDNQIKYAEENDIAATEEVQEEWRKLRTSPPLTPMGNVVVSPLIKTTWDQDDPYWKYCPSKGSQKTYVGCVATAMAQVMNYWQWPKQGTGSHSYTSEQNSLYCEADFGATTYDWDNMVDHYTTYYSGTSTISVSTPTNAQKEAVSTLMYHCGVAVEMDYGVSSQGGSGAMTIYSNASATDSRCAANALWKHFGYKKSSLKCYYRPGGYGYSKVNDATWLNLLKTELDAARPIMYGGADDEGGHSFVCDGYDDKNYFHFNWGWSGYCDGWYTVDNMVPGTGGSGAGNGSYNDDQDIIIGIEPDKTEVTITWSVAGTTTTTTQYTGSLILPTAPSDCAGGKKFVGWTAHSTITGGARPSDLFTSGSDITVTTNKTYYAVFATLESSGGTPSTTTYTFKSKAWGDDTNSWTSSKDGMQMASGKGVQVTSGFSGAGAAMSASSSGVTKVVVNYCTNGSSGAGSIEVKVGSSTLSKDVTKSGGTTLRDLEFDFSNASGAVSFTVTCTTNSIYVNAITITAGGGATYSDYSLDCGVVETKTLQSIAVNTDNVKKAFYVGDAFSSAGLVVTATYKGDETGTITTATVTGFSVSTPDMTSEGQKTVTVTYTENSVTKTATYDISVTAKSVTKYTVRWHSCAGVAEEQYEEGAALKLPTNPGANGSKVFKGWITAEHYTGATAPSYISAGGAVNANADYYAVYGD